MRAHSRAARALSIALLVLLLGQSCADEDLDSPAQRDPRAPVATIVEDAGGARLPINPSAVPYTPPPPVLSKAWPDSTRLGNPDVDAVIDAVVSRDAGRLFRLVEFHPEACTHSLLGIGGPPSCEPGEAEGTPVEVVLGMSCEGHWMPPAVASLAVEQLLAAPSALYAVYGYAGDFRPGNVAVVFEIKSGVRAAHAWSVLLDGDRIVAIDTGCAGSGRAYLEFWRATGFLLRPAA